MGYYNLEVPLPAMAVGVDAALAVLRASFSTCLLNALSKRASALSADPTEFWNLFFAKIQIILG